MDSPLLQKVPYDVLRDYAPIARGQEVRSRGPSFVASKVDQEFLALAKARPRISINRRSFGWSGHLGAELVKHWPVYMAVSPTEQWLGVTSVMSAKHKDDSGCRLVTPHANRGDKSLAVTRAQHPVELRLPTVAATGYRDMNWSA